MLHARLALMRAMLAAAIIALPADLAAGSAATGPGDKAMPMDFSHVTSREKAAALARRGELVKIRLLPKRFGGPDAPENTSYVPAGTEVALDFAHDRISGLVELKAIDRMTIKPEYRGKSKVPVAITYICHGAGDKPPITITVNIW
ncbi:hypothetical protein [Blastomonas sp. SL216]|uniref:hypothetical protein n=1 Tax=Blastomonas sp. SL216 TaxID=2995169 RepID=UPI00237754EB|nr:hypothetical protein OU999_11960 [Blastomonas sp. SL216]